ncbi:retrovirus-related pol polyprotein from transposon TNT 1-94, partial [Tanacetum coccineum]
GRQSSFVVGTLEQKGEHLRIGENNSRQPRSLRSVLLCPTGKGHMARHVQRQREKGSQHGLRDKVLQKWGEMLEERTKYVLSTPRKAYNDEINSEKKCAQFTDFEKEINYLKQTLSEQSKEKELLTKTFNVFKNESKEKEAKNIDKEIALEKKVKELDNILNRLSEDFGKRFVPQQELSDEQAFRLQTSHPNTDQSASSPVKIEAPPELIKQHNMVEKDKYNRLSKSFSKLEQHCISLELAMQLNKEIFQKNNTSVNQTEPLFDQLFDLNNLKAELQAKDTTIKKLKANIKRLNKTSITNNVEKDIDEIETINIELEHREKVLVITSLNNDLRKFKGIYIVDNAAQMSNDTTTTPGIYKYVAFRQHTCFIRNLEGVDLLIGSRGNNLYTLSLRDITASSPICLLSKASKTKSWLWHRRLSHLNFGAVNHLAGHGLVRSLPKLKFEKDHLCFACAMGKSKKKPHKPKSEDTNQEKLYLLHMDLCGPMRVASVNGKKYILVIFDDYSRFTWVKFLRTDNGTEFVNQTLCEYYENVSISHEKSVARSPQQNGKQLLLHVTPKNRSIICIRYGKTPYELLHDKPPDLSFFHVFGALNYLTNDSENLGMLQPKDDIGIFIGYAPTKKAFRIYNRRTRQINETIHVDFDELTAMASEHSSSGPALHDMTLATISSGLMPNPPPSTSFVPPSRTD